MSDSDTLYPFELLTLANLLSMAAPAWLIADHIHQDEIGVLYGKPNSGKSFVALDMALSVATGAPWLGQYATRQGPVLYLAGEGSAALQHRVGAWLSYHRHPEAVTPLLFQVRPVPLLNEEVIETIIGELNTLRQWAPDTAPEPFEPALIVIDTLSQYIMGGDEVGPEMAQFVAHVRALASAQMASVLIVHHTNKGGEQERGHTALRGNVDVMFKVEAGGVGGALDHITLTNDKQRDAALALPVYMEAIQHGESLVLAGRGLPVDLPPLQRSVLRLLRTPKTLTELHEAAEKLGISRRTVYSTLATVRKCRLIAEQKGKIALICLPPNEG